MLTTPPVLAKVSDSITLRWLNMLLASRLSEDCWLIVSSAPTKCMDRQVYLPIDHGKQRVSSMYLNLSLVPGLNETIKETTRNSGMENKAFKTDSDRREKVAQHRALFKMAVPSTSATPSPTTATGFVTQAFTAILLVVITSFKRASSLHWLQRAVARRPFTEV